MINITRSRRMFLTGLALATIMALGFGPSAPAVAEKESGYRLATGRVGGTYYPVGTAVATLITVRLQPTQNIIVTALSSDGSYENAQLLRQNQVHFALMNALVGYYSGTGQGPFAPDGPHNNLRSMGALLQQVDHYVIKKEYAKTGTIEDMKNLKGKRVFLGTKGSGTRRSSRFLLGNLGIDIDNDLDLVEYATLDEAARALLSGWIDALGVETGVPVPAVTLAMTALGDALVILDFNDAQIERAQGGLDLWTRYVIAAGTYPAQDRDINTIAIPTFLAVHAEVDEEAVYQITKTIYENLRFLQTIHKALRDTRLDNALTALPVPLHPGALRYYQEIGLAIPARLMAEQPNPGSLE